MNEPQVISIVRKLYPQFEKRAAEDVIIDYAREHELPVAQLEKIAHKVNTHRTLMQLETGDRMVSPELVDVPALSERYGQHQDSETIHKQATPTLDGRADLMSKFKWGGPIVKAAAAPVEAPQIKPDHREIRRQVVNESARCVVEAGRLLGALVKDAGQTVDLSREEELMRGQITKVAADRAMDWVTRNLQASRPKRSLVKFEGELVKLAFDLSDDRSNALSEIARLLHSREFLDKLATVAEGDPILDDQTFQSILNDPDANFTDEQIQSMSRDQYAAGKYKINGDPLEGIGDDEADTRNPLDGIGDDDEEWEKTKKTDENWDDEEESETSSSGGSSVSTKGGTSSPSPKQAGPSTASKISDGISKFIVAPTKATIQGVNNFGSNIVEGVGNVAAQERRNKDQMTSDIDVKDIRRAMAFRRLVGTDPVLREMNPRHLSQIYNAVAEANPEVAANPERIKLILRESGSYEGLTLDAQKSLADVRKNTSDSRKNEGELNKQEYTLGKPQIKATARA